MVRGAPLEAQFAERVSPVGLVSIPLHTPNGPSICGTTAVLQGACQGFRAQLSNALDIDLGV